MRQIRLLSLCVTVSLLAACSMLPFQPTTENTLDAGYVYVDNELYQAQSNPQVYGTPQTFTIDTKIEVSDEQLQAAIPGNQVLANIREKIANQREERVSPPIMLDVKTVELDTIRLKEEEWELVNNTLTESQQAKVNEAMRLFNIILPKEYRPYLKKIQIFEHPYFASTLTIDDYDRLQQELGLNIQFMPQATDQEVKKLSFIRDVIGHFGGLWGSAPNQTINGKSYFDPFGKTYDGYQEDSYLNQFYQSFWRNVSQYYIKNSDKRQQDIERFFTLNEHNFLEFSATWSPSNDFSAAFFHFIFTDSMDIGDEPKDEKIKFFYQYPQMIQLRQALLENTLKALES